MRGWRPWFGEGKRLEAGREKLEGRVNGNCSGGVLESDENSASTGEYWDVGPEGDRSPGPGRWDRLEFREKMVEVGG